VDQASKIRNDADISDLVISASAETDLVLDYALEDFGASSVAFDADGGRLVIGGMNESGQRREPRPARLLDLESKRVTHTSKTLGSGHVAFDRNGRPLQFCLPDRGKAVVWDIEKDEAVATVSFPPTADVAASCISADGSIIALAITHGSDSGEVLVWDVVSGRQRLRYEGLASALAFSPDARLFAHGDLAGRVLVREITSGRRVFELPQRSHSVRAMAFGRNPHCDAEARHGWTLAEGEGGDVRIWDISTRQVQASCENVGREVNSLTFSSDGSRCWAEGFRYRFFFDRFPTRRRDTYK
jgi:WD40 repeat protein